MRKRFMLFFLISLVLGVNLYGNNGGDGKKVKKEKVSKHKAPSYSKKVLIERIDELNATFELRFNNTVSKIITNHFGRGKRSTEIIIGRSATYFPIFEAFLAEAGLPEELKYLPIIESALDPYAVSKVGAGGLWQFMPETGRNYGLVIDDYRDERFDIYKSSAAAAAFLADLYHRYKDWTLALAAYNCGPGRVNKAIKESKSRDFWKLKKHLPKETQYYVQKFIAINYVMNYYLFHDIRPAYPDYNLQLTHQVTVYERSSFKKLSEESGISIAIIRKFNPAYKKEILPAMKKGNVVVLPKLGLSAYFTTFKNSTAQHLDQN